MAPLRIEVTGSSIIYRPAERAVVSISIRSEGTLQEKVLQNVKNASAEVRNMLTGLATKDAEGQALPDAPITHWSNSTLSTGSYHKYGDDGEEKTRIHTAQTTFSAKFQDFTQLGSVATVLSTTEHVNITNIDWRLTETTKAKLISESRQQAVRDAIQKAKDFAEALGRPVPPVTVVKDSSLDSDSGVYGAAPMAARMAYAEGAHEELNFKPEDVSLESTVVVVLEEKA